MARISVDSLAGYILEELIAYLIRNTGYRLLIDATQDPIELKNRSNGLNVIGRGALHQVDILGELSWIPAFTFPLRLIIEAKCRRSRTGIDTIRGMLATLLDVNQKHYPSVESSAQPRPKYTYVGAIFSASGFSQVASNLALAYAISLVDLNTPELLDLVEAARDSASRILSPADSLLAFAAPDGELIRAVRLGLRRQLGTLPVPETHLDLGSEDSEMNALAAAVNAAREASELFVGMAAGPYILLLRAEDPRSFLQFCRSRPTHDVSIHWSRRENGGRTWFIQPIDQPNGYKLVFKLPEVLASWIFKSESSRRAALKVKEQFFSTVSIYRRFDNRDSLIRLQYSPESIRDADSSLE